MTIVESPEIVPASGISNEPFEARVETLWREPGSTMQVFSTPHLTAGLRSLIPSTTTFEFWASPDISAAMDVWSNEAAQAVMRPRRTREDAATSTQRRAIVEHVLSSLRAWLGQHSHATNAFLLAHSAALFVNRLLIVDGPTPQINSNGAGGIEVEWLVKGTSLTIDIASESEILIYAVDASGKELFSKEITSRWSTNDAVFDQAANLLRDMSREIDARATLRS